MTFLFWTAVISGTVFGYAHLTGAAWVHLPAVWWEHRRHCFRCWAARR